MKGANLVQVLADSLNPVTTNSSYSILSNMKANNGFAIELLVISDDRNYDISIRQSALIYLKNVIQDHCRAPFIPHEDIETIKASLLEGNHPLTKHLFGMSLIINSPLLTEKSSSEWQKLTTLNNGFPSLKIQSVSFSKAQIFRAF